MNKLSALLLFLLAATLSPLVLAPPAHAQSVTNLHDYDYPSTFTQGANPFGNLVQASDGNLYGTTLSGGPSYNASTGGNGLIFKITPSGQYSILYACSDAGTDCVGPVGLIELPDGNLYGVSSQGGAFGYGDIFVVTLSGQFGDLYDFGNGGDGAYPNDNIILGNGTFGLAIIGTNSGSGTNGDPAAWGNIWEFQPDLGVGFSVFSNAYTYKQDVNGFNPISGVSIVNGNMYATSQVGGTSGCGTVFELPNGSITPTLLHSFTCGTDGGYPQGAPKLYSDNNLYGVTLENGSAGPDFGSIYKTGLQSGFGTLYTFTGSRHNPNDTIAFDTAGNIIFTAGKGGSTGVGGLYLERRSGGTPTLLWDYAALSTEGDTPYATPFFDNSGHLWTESLTGGGNSDEVGSIDAWTLTSETKPPIAITATPQTVAPNTNSTIAWTTNNAFSDNEKYCFGTGNGDSTWDGAQQAGTYSSGVLSGTRTANFSSTGDYVYAITCGGTQSANTTLHVRIGSATNLSASPTSVVEGGKVTLAISVTGNGTAPTGAVSLSVAGTVIGSVTLSNGKGSLTASTAGIAPGTYPVTASYPGDTQYSASSKTLNVTVTAATTPIATTTALTVSPTTVKSGSATTISITVTPKSGSAATGNVSLLDGTTVLATVALSGGKVSFSASTTGYGKGTYVLHATYAGSSTDAASTSSNVTVTID
jgi:uncharacterized repeat protein (TIGR03803 family)